MRRGEKMSLNQKIKIGETKKRLFKEGKIKVWNKGMKGIYYHTKKSKDKISEVTKGENNPFYGRKHTEETKKNMKGENNKNWKGGFFINKKGYKYILRPEHPRAKNNRGYVGEHILVMEKSFGRFLQKEEVVHHIDRNRLNNDIKNLELFKDNSSHIKFHHRNRK